MKKTLFLVFFLFSGMNVFSQKIQYSITTGKELFLMDNKYTDTVLDNFSVSIFWALEEESSFIWGFESGFRNGEIIDCKAAEIHCGISAGYRWRLCSWCSLNLYETIRLDFLYTLKEIKNIVLLPDKTGYDLVTDIDCIFILNDNFGILAGTGFIMGSTGLFVKMSLGFSLFNFPEIIQHGDF